MTDGIHFAAVPGGPVVTFGTTYYDAAGAAPDRIVVVVDGACNPLALASAAGMPRGTAGKGAYEATLTLAPGCHPYYFLTGSGTSSVTYPDGGALQVAVGVAAATACPVFAPTREAGSCDAGGAGGAGTGGSGASGGGGGPGPRGTGGGAAVPGTGGAVGGGGSGVSSGGGSGGAAAADASAPDGSGPGEGGAAGLGAPAAAGQTGCACAAVPGRRAGPIHLAASSLALGGLVAATLRRRRRSSRREGDAIPTP
jgi:MYXO-CTERM domain-containing protein